MFSGQIMGHAAKSKSNKYSFEGIVTNVGVEPGTLFGVGVYDKSCINVGNGLSKCDAGIKTAEYNTLNFNYLHDMKANPCIVNGDRVKIEIIDSNGTARVQRY